MSLEQRIPAILRSARIGAVVAVRTTEAFAARFRAEAERSGLTVDLEEKDTTTLVLICAVCGAQNSRYVTECFNCMSDLAAPKPVAPKQARAQPLTLSPESRFLRIFASPRLSVAPLIKIPFVRARFEAQLKPARPIDNRSVADRFLSVFVEREKVQVAKPTEGRFDQRSMLDKFLSVFVEKS